MFIQKSLLAVAAVARLTTLVAAVPRQFVPRAEICTATVTITSVVGGESASASSSSSSNPADDSTTVTIVRTITVTDTAYASNTPAASSTTPSDPQNSAQPETITIVSTKTVTATAFASPETVTSFAVSTATVTSIIVQTITQTAVAAAEDPTTSGGQQQEIVVTETELKTKTITTFKTRPAAVPTTTQATALGTRPPYSNSTGSNAFNNSTSNSTSPVVSPFLIPTKSGPSPSINGSGSGSTSTPTFPITNTSSSGYESSLYFANWAIYGANYQPQSLPVNQVTRINYAFADIDTSTGQVISSDTYADLQKHYATDSWNDNGTNAYGCVKQLYLLKHANRNLKVLLAIGGWTYSSKFSPVAATAELRAAFAASAVQLVTDWGFDGVDIDWEFNAYTPAAGDAQNIILLLQELRHAFDTWAATNAPGYRFLISVASPAGPATYDLWDMAAMDPYVDTWNLMAYDYAGSWSNASGHQANLFFSAQNPDATPYSTDQAVSAYLANGVAPSKILLGLPLYGRSFEDTAALGTSFSGVGPGDSLGAGQWRLKDLPREGAEEVFDAVAGASYSFDASTQELISYDNAQSAQAKSVYLKEKSLGGAMFWEASDDRNGTESLVGIMAGLLGGLKSTQNLLDYPTSQYNNIREMMAES